MLNTHAKHTTWRYVGRCRPHERRDVLRWQATGSQPEWAHQLSKQRNKHICKHVTKKQTNKQANKHFKLQTSLFLFHYVSLHCCNVQSFSVAKHSLERAINAMVIWVWDKSVPVLCNLFVLAFIVCVCQSGKDLSGCHGLLCVCHVFVRLPCVFVCCAGIVDVFARLPWVCVCHGAICLVCFLF